MEIGDRFNPFKQFTGIFIPTAIARYSKISPGAKLCWGRLAQYAGDDGRCFPKQETLAAEIGVSDRQVRTYLKDLMSHGFLVIERSGKDILNHQANTYYFLWHSIFVPSEVTDIAPSERKDTSGSGRTDTSGCLDDKENQDKENQKEEPASPKPDSRDTHDLSLISPEIHNLTGRLYLSVKLNMGDNYYAIQKPRLKKWVRDSADSIDKMVRLDNVDSQTVREVIEFLRIHEGNNGFKWGKQILSGRSLRKSWQKGTLMAAFQSSQQQPDSRNSRELPELDIDEDGMPVWDCRGGG